MYEEMDYDEIMDLVHSNMDEIVDAEVKCDRCRNGCDYCLMLER